MILSGNKILTLIKGHNFVTNKQNMTDNNHNPDLSNMNAYIKFGKILLINFVLRILSRNEIMTPITMLLICEK